MQGPLTPAAALPADGASRWSGDVVPGAVPGPSVVALRNGGVFDLSRAAPTITDVLNADDPVALARTAGERLGELAPILANSASDRRDPRTPYFLAPCDLQALKASG
jgi:fumarylacetoacetate (FAA) hydrolase family protein